MNRLVLASSILGVAAAGVYRYCQVPNKDESPVELAGNVSSVPKSRSERSVPSDGGGWSIFYSAQLARLVTLDPGWVGIRSTETDPVTGLKESSYYMFGVSYTPIAVAGTGSAQEFYIVGETRGGLSIIEHWDLTDWQSGSLVTVPGPVGQDVVVRGGGAYIPHAARVPWHPIPVRTEVYSGSVLSGIKSFLVDAEGDHLIFLTKRDQARIERLATDGLASIEELYTEVGVPELASSTGVSLFAVVSGGWAYQFNSTQSPYYVIDMRDGDADGEPDSISADVLANYDWPSFTFVR